MMTVHHKNIILAENLNVTFSGMNNGMYETKYWRHGRNSVDGLYLSSRNLPEINTCTVNFSMEIFLCAKVSRFPAKEHNVSTEDQYRHLLTLMDECVEK